MLSVKYHKIFDYDLVKSDLPKWLYAGELSSPKLPIKKSKQRLERERISEKKFKIAKKASTILSKIPTIKFVGVTGSLAMMNCKKNSDIDLLVITSKNLLWTTRLVTLFTLIIFQIPFRRAHKTDEANKLCLNMWLDESNLDWDKKDRNIYTAHEIAQIVPLVNKDKTYERLLYLNRWILNFWPYSVSISKAANYKAKTKLDILSPIFLTIEKASYKLQLKYMKSKMTREIVTANRAIFHPNDWGKVVLKKLKL